MPPATASIRSAPVFSQSEIRALEIRVSQQFMTLSSHYQSATFDHIAAITDLESLLYFLFDQDNCNTFVSDLLDYSQNLLDEIGCNSQRRLVEHYALRNRHQTSTDGEHLLFAATEGPGELILAFLQPGKHGAHFL